MTSDAAHLPSAAASAPLAISASARSRIETLRPPRSHPCGQAASTATLTSAPASTGAGNTSMVHVQRPCTATAVMILDRRLLRRVGPGDEAVHRCATDTVLRAAAARLAARVEARNDLTLRVHHLGLAVDPQTAIGVVDADSRCRRVE